MRLFNLLGTFVRLSMMNELQYRANFFMELFNSLLSVGIGVAGLGLVFYHTDSLGDWGLNELLVVMSIHILIGGLMHTIIQPNMERLMERVREGTLDYVLTKPEDSQVMVSVMEIRIWKTVYLVLGTGVLVLAIIRLGGQTGLAQAGAFGLAMLCGGLIVYGVWLILTTTAFWFVDVWGIMQVFDSFYQAGRWPVGIYPGWLRLGLTFLVPVAFAVTVPAEALTGRLTLPTLALAVGMTVMILVLARWFWHVGLRNYTGASA